MKTSQIKIKSNFSVSSSTYLYLSALLTSLLALLVLLGYTDGSIQSTRERMYQLARIETSQSRRPVVTDTGNNNVSPSLTLEDQPQPSSAFPDALLFSKSSAWTHRFWIMEERKHLPLLFDFNRTNLKASYEFSNTAFTAVPGNNGQLLVSVRSSSMTHVRWGRQCALGMLNADTITELARGQPPLSIKRSDIPLSTMPADFDKVPEFSTQQIEQLQPARRKFKTSQRQIYKSNKLYDAYQDSEIWAQPLCVVRGFGIPDVRLFFRWNQAALQVCFMSDLSGRAYNIPKAQQIACLPYEGLIADDPLSSNPPMCPPVQLVYRLPEHYNRRNIVPLIESNGIQWEGSKTNSTWLMDTMGSAMQGPAIFPVLIQNQLETPGNNMFAAAPSDEEYSLDNCEYMAGWRGNTPVIRFTNLLWISIVHKHGHSEKSRLNRIGRSYINRVVVFQADAPGGLPTKCLPNGPEATGRDIFQRQPALDFEWPFAFILGLVHLGKIETLQRGERHQFLVSAGLDDSQPAFKVFDIFLPTDAV